tara:strand:+ start:223 stop:1185 length:963 start_codon:yes stop_codon:yes gene_type:complete
MQIRFHVLAAVLAAAMLTAGCTRQQPRIRLGLLVWPPYEMFYLARDLGCYDGVAVELVDYHTPAEALRAYQNGVVDGVAMTLDFLMQISEREAGHRAILVIDYSHGGDCVIARPGIAGLADLHGKTIGLEMSALGQFMLARTLEFAGLKSEDVELKFLDIPDHMAAYNSGSVDAVITYEPVRTELLASGGNLVFDSTKIPNEIADVLFVRDSLIAARGPTLQAIVDGYFAAMAHLAAQPEDAAARCAGREGLTPVQFLDAMNLVRMPSREENQSLLGGQAPGLVATAERTLEILIRSGQVSKPLPLFDLVDDHLVRSDDG